MLFGLDWPVLVALGVALVLAGSALAMLTEHTNLPAWTIGAAGILIWAGLLGVFGAGAFLIENAAEEEEAQNRLQEHCEAWQKEEPSVSKRWERLAPRICPDPGAR